MYIPVLLLFFVNSISSYVINGTERGDSLDKTAYKSAYNQYKLSEELHNVKILTENDPEHGNFDKGYVKNHAKSGGASEPQGSTKSLSATDLNKLLAKANDKYSTGLNGVPNTGGVPNTDILGKYQSSIPYFVTKNDNIIGLSDVNMGTLPGGPLRGAVPNVGLPNQLGGGKMNFSMGTYMKYLTRNSSLSPSDMYKYVFSKKCANSYNMICLKLDLIKILSNINNDNNRSISIIPHVMSISMSPTTPIPDQETAADQSSDYAVLTQLEDQQKLEDSQTQDLIKNKNLYEEMVLKNNYNTNYYINNILKKKIIGLLNNMSLNVKLFDNTTVEIIKKLVHGYGQSGDGANVAGEKEVFDGRGRKRQKNMIVHAIASAAMMSGGTLLVLGLKALAAMATKALIASMIALVLTCFSNFGGGHGGHKGDLKSTTYEIITKPLVSHAHLHTSEVQHAEPSSVGYNTYARSGPDPYMFDPLDVMPLQHAILNDKSNDNHIIHVNPVYAESRESVGS